MRTPLTRCGTLLAFLLATASSAARPSPSFAAAAAYDQVSRLQARVREVEADLVEHLTRRNRATGVTARSLDARINLRVILHRLYHAGARAGEHAVRTRIAAQADFLRQGLAELDAQLESLALWERDLAALPSDPTDAAVAAQRAELQSRIDGVQVLSLLAKDPTYHKLDDPEVREKLINRLAAAIVMMVQPDLPREISEDGDVRLSLPSARPNRPPAGGDSATTRSSPPDDVAALRKATQGSDLPATLRALVLGTLDHLQAEQAAQNPKPDAPRITATLHTHVRHAQVLMRSRLIPDTAKARIVDEIHTGLLLSSDERTKQLGDRRLAFTAGAAAILGRLAKVEFADELQAFLTTAFEKVLQYRDNPALQNRADELMQRLDAYTQRLLQQLRRFDDQPTGRYFSEPFEKLRAAWQTSAQAGLQALAEEKLDESDKEQARMRRHAEELQVVLLAVDTLEGLKEVKASRGRQFRDALVDACNGIAAQDAKRAPGIAFVRGAKADLALIERYRRLASEHRLYDPMDRLLGGRLELLRRIANAAVNDVLDDLTAGRTAPPPAAPGKADADPLDSRRLVRKSLTQIVDLLSAVRDVARNGALRHEIEHLRRWRAWPVEAAASERILAGITRSITAAAERIRGRSLDLEEVLPPIAALAPHAHIVAEMAATYGGHLAESPEGLLGLAARLYNDADVPLQPNEVAAIRIAYEINEAAYALELGLTGYAARHLAEARRLLPVALRR